MQMALGILRVLDTSGASAYWAGPFLFHHLESQTMQAEEVKEI
jgi:hypothetical protein